MTFKTSGYSTQPTITETDRLLAAFNQWIRLGMLWKHQNINTHTALTQTHTVLLIGHHHSRCPRSVGQPCAPVTVNEWVLMPPNRQKKKQARRPTTRVMKCRQFSAHAWTDTRLHLNTLAWFHSSCLIHNCPIQEGVSIESAYQGPFLKPGLVSIHG